MQSNITNDLGNLLVFIHFIWKAMDKRISIIITLADSLIHLWISFSSNCPHIDCFSLTYFNPISFYFCVNASFHLTFLYVNPISLTSVTNIDTSCLDSFLLVYIYYFQGKLLLWVFYPDALRFFVVYQDVFLFFFNHTISFIFAPNFKQLTGDNQCLSLFSTVHCLLEWALQCFTWQFFCFHSIKYCSNESHLCHLVKYPYVACILC